MELALRRYLHAERVDVQAIAVELGLGRSTIYRWFGSRTGLLGEVLVRAAGPILETAHAQARGTGAARLLDTFDRINRDLAAAPALRAFLAEEREALAIVTSEEGGVRARLVERITGFVEEEVRTGAYEPAVEPATLAYAIVRLAEAFLYNDTVTGIRGDVDRLREVEAALLGVRLDAA